MKKTLLSVVSALLFMVYSTSLLAQAETYSFAVVPQQSTLKLARTWLPLLAHISKQAGIKLRFVTAKDIPTFEKECSRGNYDFAYMNPYHYILYHNKPGYKAFAMARDKKITGIIVVRKDSHYQSLKELANHIILFPSPKAFAASMLTQSELLKYNISFVPKYVVNHDSVYIGVVKNIFPAGGGILRTYKALHKNIRDNLRILYTTRAYTPHAFAVHPRVPETDTTKILQAFKVLEHSEQGRKFLQMLKIKGITNATDQDWDNVRKIDFTKLNLEQ